jgi:hypothetical protein
VYLWLIDSTFYTVWRHDADVSPCRIFHISYLKARGNEKFPLAAMLFYTGQQYNVTKFTVLSYLLSRINVEPKSNRHFRSRIAHFDHVVVTDQGI